MTSIGTLYIIAAASGTGKTALVNALIDKVDNLYVSVSYTTRVQRPREKEGEDYFFITQNQFKSMTEKGSFLEYAHVFDHYYGTSRLWVEAQLNSGKDIILEIDWQGARQVRSGIKNTASVFILPPSYNELRNRLLGRKQDDEKTIERRMNDACEEISHYNEFDYILINDSFDTALTDLASIVASERLRLNYQQQKQAQLLSKLL
ncbi:MAG: guanylate kinase [Gammaproteobacteria bacterium]